MHRMLLSIQHYASVLTSIFSIQEQDLIQALRRGWRKSVRPDAVTVGFGRVRTGGGAARSRLGARLPSPDHGTQRAGHLPRVPGKREGVGTRTQAPEDRAREQAEGQRAEGPQAGADADDADVSAAAGEETSGIRGAEGELSEREAEAGS